MFLVDGAITWNVTSEGTESGCEPILDSHGEVVVKALDAAGLWRAGIKNAGIESVD